MLGARSSALGTLSGTLRSPSMSSLNAISRVGRAGQLFIGMADEGRPKHFVEGADVRQARWAVAGFEDDGRAARLAVGKALQQLARFLIRPGLGLHRGGTKACRVQIRCSSVLEAPMSGSGRSFASSRASRNPCGNLACRRVRRRARGAARRSDRAEPPKRRTSCSMRRWSGSGLAMRELSGLDLLELFAFVHPARFAVPTPAGLSRALGLEPPASEADAAAVLQARWPRRCSSGWATRAGPSAKGRGRSTPASPGSAGRWAPLVARRLERARRRRADAVFAA